MKKILIFGLPGSGKTTLASRLTELLATSVWYNADKVREEHNDWDFSMEGRKRQMERMKSLSSQTINDGKYAIVDFVCPTNELRQEFDADITVFMDTVSVSRYDDTNAVFQRPLDSDYTITGSDWWTDEWVEHWARLLAVEIKDYEFDTQKPTTQMLGRFQPFHLGHRALFERALVKHGQVAILIRDMPIADNNPWNQSVIETNIKKELVEHAGKFRIYKVPNIVNITYGRDVGYKIEQEVFDETIHSISATDIRKKMREKGKL
jgi:phosphopantetheine adenylyltransferase